MKSPTAKRLATVLAVTAVALVAGEFAARAAFPAPDGFHVYPPGLHKVFRPADNVMPGIEGDAHFDVDSLGYRGDEPPEGAAYRILAVGGSTTECAYLDQPKSWPELLEGMLGGPDRPAVWVANAGRSGFTSRRHVLQLRHLLPQGPRFDAVVLLVGVNDLAKRLEYGDDPPDPRELQSETVPLVQCFYEVPASAAGQLPFQKRLGLWRMAKAVQGWVRPSVLEQDEVGRKYVKWRLLRREAAAIREVLPDLDGALEAYAHNIEQCVAIAREQGVRLILVDQPSMWRADLSPKLERLLWLGGVGKYQYERNCDYYSVEALAAGMARYNEVLRRVAEEQGVEFVDADAALPKDTSSFYDDVHFNEGGARRAAEAIAEHMLARPPFADEPAPGR